MNTIRNYLANKIGDALIRAGKWIKPQAGPIGEDPK
tara:strand:- start:106 stop:213 length:108 start_codon:yes stop_codon:yes gene_type:complete